MSQDLDTVEAWIGGILEKATPAERRKLARLVARDLQRSQSARIGAQKNPDGSSYVARKPQDRQALRAKAGRIRRKAAAARSKPKTMFEKLRRAKFLGQEATSEEASVGFASNSTARIARVHQDGLRDRVSRRAGAREITYPVRILLGFTEEERAALLDRYLDHLEP